MAIVRTPPPHGGRSDIARRLSSPGELLVGNLLSLSSRKEGSFLIGWATGDHANARKEEEGEEERISRWHCGGGGEGGRDVHSVVGAHAKKGRKSISLGACNCEREWAVEMRT